MKTNFFRNHLFFSTIIFVICCFFLSLLAGQMLAGFLGRSIGWNDQSIAGQYMMQALGKSFAIVVTFIFIYVSGMLREIKTEWGSLKYARSLFLVLIIVALYNVIGDGIANRDVAYSEFHPDALLACVLYALATAVLEELVCRVLLLQNMYYSWKEKPNGTLQAVFVSSVIFGVCHLLNLPAGVGVTLFQVYYAIIAGVIFAAMYLLSKNIWVCILSHFLIDFCGAIGYSCMPNERAMVLAAGLSGIDLSAVLMVVFMTIGAVYAVYLLLKQKPEFQLPDDSGTDVNPVEENALPQEKSEPANHSKLKIVIPVLVVVVILIAGGYVLSAKYTTNIILPDGKDWVCTLETPDLKTGITFDDTSVTLTYGFFSAKDNVLVCTNREGETFRYALHVGTDGAVEVIPEN